MPFPLKGDVGFRVIENSFLLLYLKSANEDRAENRCNPSTCSSMSQLFSLAHTQDPGTITMKIQDYVK